MADTRQRTTIGTRFRFLTRALGLSGVLALVAGFAMGIAQAPASIHGWDGAWRHVEETVRTVLAGGGTIYVRVAAWLVLGGAAAIAAALVVEILSGLLLVTSRRTAASATATAGTVAVLALLIIVNAYSYTHHKRFDITRQNQFTLPADLADRLRTLRAESPTTIVVLQKHRIFGTLSDDRDAYTKAAEEKVTEKVKDLVDLFRELGPRFRVVVLDTETFHYKEQLDNLTKDAPELKSAIEAAPENSIFFFANQRVQRLSFNEFLQLDKTTSREFGGGRGNLVLLPQGIENFARRVLAVQERRPKVAVCVVHEWLSTVDTTGQAQFSLGGLKRTLTDHGFDVIDIILKKNWEVASKDLEPAAYTVYESKIERLEGELDSAQDQLRGAQIDVKIIASIRKEYDELPGKPIRERGEFYIDLSRAAQLRGWAEIVRAFRQWLGQDSRPISEENEPEFRKVLAGGIARQATRAEQEVKEAEKARTEAEESVKAAYRDERSVQDRRVSDVKAKFAGLLADVDLLIIPRYTVVNATIGPSVPRGFHNLSKPQVEVIKDFMKAGKPVLACLGSLSGPGGFEADSRDDLESLFADRGIELGRETILFDSEAKAFAALKSGRQLGGSASDIPPLIFDAAPPGTDRAKPNPVGSAVRLTGRSVDQKLDLRLHAPRPVYLASGWQERLPYAAEFLFTGPDSWNEEKPFLTADRATGRVSYTPRYEPTLDNDSKWGTHLAERKGPFPIGVALESKIPTTWVNEAYGREQLAAGLLLPVDAVFAAGITAASTTLDRPTERLIVFGSGNIFSGAKLEPPQEKLLLHSVNWLTAREDRLPHAEEPAWSFPRVDLSDRDVTLWRFGTLVGLPLVAVYFGLMVMMVRRLR